MELPQEYWWEQTLFQIANTSGMSPTLDTATKNRVSSIMHVF